MAQESRDFAAEWADLHGHPWPTAAAQLAPDAATELAGMRSAGFLDAPNLFEAAVAASRGADRLLLWGPFLNVAPMHALDNGDVLHVHVPSPRLAGARPAIVVWDHQRDLFEAPRPGDLGGLAPGDPANPLRFCVRSLYIVEALARGRFELDLFTAFDHPVIEAARPDYQANLRDYPPTALYALWHLWFAKDDARLNMLLPVVAQSPSRWIRDCGRLMQQILAGRNELGAITDLRALREQAATVINDPVVRERAAATRRRADLDAFLAGQRGLRLVRTDRQGKPCETATRARLDNGLELTVTAAGPRTSLVLRRDGRALSAFALSGDGGNARHEHSVQVAGGKAAVLYRRSSRDHPQFPRDGQLTLLGLRDNRLAPITSLAFDLDGLELDGGEILARTLDGARYRIEGALDVPAAVWLPPVGAIPAVAAQPPAKSTPATIGDEQVELTPTSLRVLRDGRLLLEEPMFEAWQMAVMPARRMVAVHHAGYDLRPVIDVFWVRPLDQPAPPGEGGTSWVSWPVDGLDVALRATADTLFVGLNGHWFVVEPAVLDTVPSWIKARGWL